MIVIHLSNLVALLVVLGAMELLFLFITIIVEIVILDCILRSTRNINRIYTRRR